MRFGIITLVDAFTLDEQALQRLLPICKANGVKALEIPFPALRLWNPVESIKAFKQNAGIESISICMFHGGDSPNPTELAEAADAETRVREACEFARSVGAQKLTGPWAFKIGQAGFLAGELRFIDRVLPICETAGLVACLEPLREKEDKVNMGWRGVVELLEKTPASLKIHFDTFHAQCWEIDSRVALERIGGRLGHVHVSGLGRGIPGSDDCPYASGVCLGDLKAGLDNAHYEGDVVLEVFGPRCREEIPDIVDANFPSAVSAQTAVEMTRANLQRFRIL